MCASLGLVWGIEGSLTGGCREQESCDRGLLCLLWKGPTQAQKPAAGPMEIHQCYLSQLATSHFGACSHHALQQARRQEPWRHQKIRNLLFKAVGNVVQRQAIYPDLSTIVSGGQYSTIALMRVLRRTGGCSRTHPPPRLF